MTSAATAIRRTDATTPIPLRTAALAAGVPALALAYLWSVAWLGHIVAAIRADARHPLEWTALAAATALILAVPVGGVVAAHALGRIAQPTRRALRAQWIAHLAVAAPSLLVAFGNYSRILHARGMVTPAWIVLWSGCLAAVLFGSTRPATLPDAAPAWRPRVRTLHGFSALALGIVYLLPHVTNHVTAIWSGAAHIAVMSVLRTVYRSAIVEPLLVALLVFQGASGMAMVTARVRGRTTDVFQTLQTTSGVYVAVFLLSHLAAAFSARAAHVDTNWIWLVGRSGTLLASSSLTVVPHYFFGPIALAVHVGCGVRNIVLARGASGLRADRLARGVMAAGVLASVVIMAALFGVHLQQ